MGGRPAGTDGSSGLVRSSLRDQVRERLLDGLVSGRWQPGERIVERRIAAELEVSQAPVREALRELETLRLIESVPGKGARVRDFTPEDLAEIYPVRAALERLAAELGSDRIRNELFVLEARVEAMRRAAAAGESEAESREVIAFHRTIVEAAENRVLLYSWESLGIEVWTALSLRWFRRGPHDNAAEHAPLIEAFRTADPRTPVLLYEHVLSCSPVAAGA
jgi:DNA-binding GntR family transcriptional regulator